MNQSRSRFTGDKTVPALMVAAVLSLIILGACASTPAREEAALKAWSLRVFPEDMVVAVSPVRQTMQIAGSFATVIGAAITAAQDAEIRNRLKSALGTLNYSEVFRKAIADEMISGSGTERLAVDPPADVRNPQERREAERKRLNALRRQGIAEIVDISVKYGLYGAEGELVAVVQAVQTETRNGRTTFKAKWLIPAEPPNAFARLGDPTRRMTPNITSPRLAKAPYAVDRWLVSDAQPLRQGLLRLAANTARVLAVSVNGKAEPQGWYVLGMNALRHKKYREAHTFLQKAVQAEPQHPDFILALAVTLDKLGQRDDAIPILRLALEQNPEQPRLMVNLAWLLARDRQRADEAENLFRQAVELGAPDYPAVRRAIEKNRNN